MNLPAALRTIRWMVRDTFRQSISTKLFWVMTTVAAVFTLLCFSVGVSGDMAKSSVDYDPNTFITKAEAERLGADKVNADGVRVVSGEVSLGFGTVTLPVGRHRDDAVKFVQLWVAGAIADTLGVLMALLWTAGFLPTFLEPQHASVLLAKPAPRWSILLGKYLGVVGFVALQAVLFVGGTWLALGVRTGVWTGEYWLAVPLLVVNFGIFYAVSAFLAVATRSTIAAAFGTLLFWILCWAMNYTHFRLIAAPIDGVASGGTFLLDVGYWLLPKPLDLGGIFFDAMRADGFSAKLPELRAAQEQGKFFPVASVLSSLAFAATTLGLASYEFEKTEY